MSQGMINDNYDLIEAAVRASTGDSDETAAIAMLQLKTDQMGAWASVHLGKWSSWSLLVVMTFTIVANLKHIKTKIHVPH